jgi:REP element-mobilizing transposase RayT
MQERAYRRNLPHIFPKGTAIFLTWRLHGAVTNAFLAAVHNTPGLSEGQRFARIDRHVDATTRGPLWLRDPEIAEEACLAIERGAEPPLLQYALHEYVVMPNHVHVLLTPVDDVARITKGIKGTTARFANMQLGRAGNPFWQRESYDHFCRNPREFERIREYIGRNPVRAGLVAKMEDWPWSSVHRRAKLKA